ncbi:MAG: hypothetical protein ACK5NT_13730 [Pyrinomonadaceae bacterium]
MKKTLLSIVFGLVLAIVPIAAYASCPDEIQIGKKACWLTGENCEGSVCVCSYNCG